MPRNIKPPRNRNNKKVSYSLGDYIKTTSGWIGKIVSIKTNNFLKSGSEKTTLTYQLSFNGVDKMVEKKEIDSLIIIKEK